MVRFCLLRVAEHPNGSENGTENALLKIPSVGGGEGLRNLHRSDSGREATAVAKRRGGFVPMFKTPLKSLLVQGGTLFSSNVAPPSGMKNSNENPPYQRGKEGETTAVVKPSGGCRAGFGPTGQPNPPPR